MSNCLIRLKLLPITQFHSSVYVAMLNMYTRKQARTGNQTFNKPVASKKTPQTAIGEIMKIQSVLGLCLSGCLLIAGPLALADDDKDKSNNRSARAVQVHIDKDGRKTAPADSDDAALTSVATATATDSRLSKVMPAQNSEVQYNADGSASAQLGRSNLKYLVMKIDEDGEKSVSHQTAQDLESASMTESSESEEK